jgi:Flp pilus assembly protein TadD
VNNKLDQLWERASALDAAGDQAGATKLLERLLRREPWHIDASIRLASIDIFHGRYDEAIQRFERLSRVKRDVASVHTTLSTVYLFAHRRDEALASALQSVRLRPDDPWPHVILARALAARDDLDAAHAELERACGLRPSVVQQAEIQVEIGRVAEQQGKYEECSMHYRRAITLVPALALAHERLGEALLRLGRFERGWQEFEWRRHSPRFKSGMPPAPPGLYWTGSEDLHGKTIFVLNGVGGLSVRNRTVAYCTQCHGWSGAGRFRWPTPGAIPLGHVYCTQCHPPRWAPGLLRAIRLAGWRHAVHSDLPRGKTVGFRSVFTFLTVRIRTLGPSTPESAAATDPPEKEPRVASPIEVMRALAARRPAGGGQSRGMAIAAAAARQ